MEEAQGLVKSLRHFIKVKDGRWKYNLSPDVASLWQNFLDSIPEGVDDVPMSQLPKYHSPLSLPVRVGSSTEKESTDESNDNSMVIEQAPILRFGRLPSEVRALQSACASAVCNFAFTVCSCTYACPFCSCAISGRGCDAGSLCSCAV